MGDAPKTMYTFLDPVPADGEPASEVYLKTVPCKASVVYANGDKYQGEFNEFKQKHGNGKYSYYIAEKLDEEGEVIEDARAYTYEGMFKFNRKEGIGKLTYPNGDVYHGEWLKNVKHGEGAYVTKDGDMYSGSWWKGMKHGRGTYVYKKDQSQLIGKWVQNNFKEGQWAFKDGTVYSGRFVQNHPIGRGTFKFPNGNEQDVSPMLLTAHFRAQKTILLCVSRVNSWK